MEKIAFLSLLQWIAPATSLICYTTADASEYKFCNEHDGFNTCYASYDKYGQILERGCSTKQNICDDLSSSDTAYGFPVSRGCENKEKISVKTRDCENRVENGQFLRICYCRRRLCNIGYDPLLEKTGGVRYRYRPGISGCPALTLQRMVILLTLALALIL